MATTEQFSLRWNNFHSNLTAGFHDLLEASEMVDVTLGVDGQYLQAHKLVLSICSPYFKQLFRMNPCKHPIVILKDVTHGNLKDILQFMYLGEVNVLRENLSSFLRTAELLQVKGLTGDDSSDTSSKKDERLDSLADTEEDQELSTYNQSEQDMEEQSHYHKSLSPSNRLNTSATSSINTASQKRYSSKNLHSSHNVKRSKSDCNYNQTSNIFIKSELPSANTEDDESDYIMAPRLDCDNEDSFHMKDVNRTNLDINQSSGSIGDVSMQDQGKAKTTSTTTTTTTTSSTSLSSSTTTTPSSAPSTTTKYTGHPYKCTQCVKQFSRRDHLRTHEKNIHGEDAGPFACIICSQLYKNTESLRKHIAKFHYQKATDANNVKNQLNDSLAIQRSKSIKFDDGY